MWRANKRRIISSLFRFSINDDDDDDDDDDDGDAEKILSKLILRHLPSP